MKELKIRVCIVVILPSEADVAIAASISCRCGGFGEGQCNRHLLRVSL